MPTTQPRCDAQAVQFLVYERRLHPELTDAVEQIVERHGGAELAVSITPTGHQLVWSCRDETTGEEAVLTEIVGVPDVTLPRLGRAADHAIDDSRDVNHTFAGGFGYYAASSARTVDADTFAQLDSEIEAEGLQTQLSHVFSDGNRLARPARSVLRLEPMADSLVLHSTHTYPDALTIVRTQSLFELP